MKISELIINHHASKVLGLKEMSLSGLDRLIVLVGKNGCGKSRMLSVVDWLLRQHERIGYKKIQGYHDLRNQFLKHAQNLLEDYADHYSVAGATSDADAIEQILIPMTGMSLALEKSEDADASLKMYCKLADALNKCMNTKEGYQLSLSLGLPRGNDTIDQSLVINPLIYIEDICRRLKNEMEYESVGFHSPDSGVNSCYSSLKKLIEKLCSLELNIQQDAKATLNNLPLSSAKLSDGQMTLLRFAVLIHSGVLDDFGVPILLDEPELNLHPNTLIGLVDTLLETLPKSQIWIATHSLALAAHLTFGHSRAIWFGEDGKFSRVGKTPDKVVSSLLGGNGGAAEIADFCTLPDQFAAVSYAAECLLDPVTVPYKKSDPQISQIHELLPKVTSQPVRILDFGAGQGRLLEGLLAECDVRNISASAEISYYAVEVDEKWRELCLNQVGVHYPDADERVFGSVAAALAKLGKTVDVVVMANVLHEIDPVDWLHGVFGADGIGALLRPGGKLLIIEDTRLPRGELAHSSGFLVLEHTALAKLFGVSESGHFGIRFLDSPGYGSRLQATEIDSSLLDAVSAETIIEAIRVQLNISMENARKLRGGNRKSDYDSGRIHAYHIQSIANATLALDTFSKGIARN